MTECELRGVTRFFAQGGEALLHYTLYENGALDFHVGSGAQRHPLALVRLLDRERRRLKGARFSLVHDGDAKLLRVARLLGQPIPSYRPCEITL